MVASYREGSPPRAWGQSHLVLRRCPTFGSPPRAWGQLLGFVRLPVTLRFTPTGVGTMFWRLWGGLRRAVHPHGRGDNARRHDLAERIAGSPPRAWGQCSSSAVHGLRLRFTPTGVGTMERNLVPAIPSTVHPHGRGDNALSAASLMPSPAVHPHGRGDNYQCSARQGYGYGSPPRAWGQSFRHTSRAAQARFTPTGVGTIDHRAAHGGATMVHPHGRGDNTRCRARPTCIVGSPPRAWGQ